MTTKPITAEQMKHYDSYTINTIGIPSLVLMERAALAVRDHILHHFAD
jgi:NAD(P)H-hydrate repair Nnr-like enzyme with NAD(P)H-hydrate epimerase domain